MKNELERKMSAPSLETVEIDENAWNAWLEKGRKQDRMRLRRLKGVIYVLVILASFAVVWIYQRK
jgi:hypothetical protein